MVGYAGSPTYTAYVDMTLTRSKVKGQGQGHGAFELPTTSEAVHAGGDDRSPLVGLYGFTGRMLFLMPNRQRQITEGMIPRCDGCKVCVQPLAVCDAILLRNALSPATVIHHLCNEG